MPPSFRLLQTYVPSLSQVLRLIECEYCWAWLLAHGVGNHSGLHLIVFHWILLIDAGDSGADSIMPCFFDNLVSFTDSTFLHSRPVASNTSRDRASVCYAFGKFRVKTDDHAGEVVRAESREGMIHKDFGGELRVKSVADQVNCFLI